MCKNISPSPSPFDSQARIQACFLHHIGQDQPGPEAPLIAYDLYGVAPLTAFLGFVTDLETDLLVTVHGRCPEANLSYPLAGKDRVQMVPIVGLYPQGPTRVSLKIGAKTYDLTLEVPGDLPPVPAFRRQVSGPAQSLTFFLPADGVHKASAFDCQGDLRWMTSLDLSHRLHLSRAGYLLAGGPGHLSPPKGPTDLVWMDLTGRLAKRVRRPGGFTGDFLELPDRTLVAIGSSPQRGTVADRLVWIDAKTGQEKREVDLKDLVALQGPGPGRSGTDWFGADGLSYDEAGHRLVLTGLGQGQVLVLDAATGRLLETFPKEEGETFHQPAKAMLAGDQVTLLENHRFDGKGPSLACFSLEGDQDHVLWQDKALSSPVFNTWTPHGPDAGLLHLGGQSDLEEEAQAAAPSAYSLYPKPGTKLWSTRLLLKSGQVQVLDRLETASLDSLDLSMADIRFVRLGHKGLDAGSWGQGLVVDTPMEVTGEDTADDDMIADIWADDTQVYLRGTFYQGDVALVRLRQGEDLRHYYIQVNRWPHGRDWLKSANTDVVRPLTWAIPIEGLKGTWEIDLWVDGILYHSPYVLDMRSL